jgi:hypothetical protein
MVLDSETDNPFTPIKENDIEVDVLFYDTVQRNANSSPATSVDRSLSSELVPTTLVHSPVPINVSIPPTMGTITIGGIAIAVESTEQVWTMTRALYTKAIRKTYDDDKKGKLDLLKLVQSKQQQPYVATSISVNDPEKLLNHYSLSKLNSFQAIVPYMGHEKGVFLLKGSFSLKNGT